MAGESSFDVVSEFDRQELVNAIDQTLREVHTRYDLKDSGAGIELEKTELEIKAPDTMALNAVRDILQSKMVSRKLSLKVVKFDEPVEGSGGSQRQRGALQMGLSQDLARQISKLLRDNHPKVKSQIQGDAIRVSSKSKNDLQAVQAELRSADYPVPLQFTNYR
ncbi:MAG: YajQ family cyclic di-GMP-binding protein [Chloroflexota bacterium]